MLRIAVKAAKKSRNNRYRHGAIVLRGGKIISTGHNFATKHAEVVALSKIKESLRKGCVVWSVRITESGDLVSNARPCKNCMDFMIKYKIKTVYYTNKEREIKKLNLIWDY